MRGELVGTRRARAGKGMYVEGERRREGGRTWYVLWSRVYVQGRVRKGMIPVGVTDLGRDETKEEAFH